MDSKQAHAGEQAYDEKFYRVQKDGSFKSASAILPLVAEFVHPRSVVDVGCGVGPWLAVWQKNFSAEVYGIDGDYVDRSQLFIDEKFFQPVNLEERINFDRRFDLVETLEKLGAVSLPRTAGILSQAPRRNHFRHRSS